ncbi:MAG: cupin domain-containing protein [Patescibacteria group bacterium]
MAGFHTNIEKDTLENENYRKVIYTAQHMQVVLMTLRAGEEIGMETHAEHDQFIRVENGEGKAYLNDSVYDLADGSAVVIPAGTQHNIVNTGSGPMRLYTIYTPPEHPDGTLQATKAEADAAHH